MDFIDELIYNCTPLIVGFCVGGAASVLAVLTFYSVAS